MKNLFSIAKYRSTEINSLWILLNYYTWGTWNEPDTLSSRSVIERPEEDLFLFSKRKLCNGPKNRCREFYRIYSFWSPLKRRFLEFVCLSQAICTPDAEPFWSNLVHRYILKLSLLLLLFLLGATQNFRGIV